MKTADEHILKQIGEVIVARRKELNITQEELAFRAGIDRTYIGYIENGRQNFSVSVLCSIASALNLKVSELFNETTETTDRQTK